MSSLPPFANNNLTQIFFALLPDLNAGQNIGKKEKISEIQDLLKYGVNVNIEIRPGYTPLCKVIEEGGSKSLVELLLHYGANVITATPGFEWKDVDGQIITHKAFALARQRSIRCQDKESLEIQHLIQKHLIQRHLSSAGEVLSQDLLPQDDFSEELLAQNEDFEITLPPPKTKVSPLPIGDIYIKKKLYIFDLEHTLVNTHFHNVLKDMGVAHGRASKDLIDFMIEKYGLKNKAAFLQMFRDILENGDCISIATHTRYPETVIATLVALGLTNDELDQIFYVEPDLSTPADLTYGKNLNILQAMVHFGIIDINAIYLIDHEQTNLQIAKSKLNIPQSNLIKAEKESEDFLSQIRATIKKKSMVQEIKLPAAIRLRDEQSVSLASNTVLSTSTLGNERVIDKPQSIKMESIKEVSLDAAKEEHENEQKEETQLAQREPLKVWTSNAMPYINFGSSDQLYSQR